MCFTDSRDDILRLFAVELENMKERLPSAERNFHVFYSDREGITHLWLCFVIQSASAHPDIILCEQFREILGLLYIFLILRDHSDLGGL